jgi:hypothetical protein
MARAWYTMCTNKASGGERKRFCTKNINLGSKTDMGGMNKV